MPKKEKTQPAFYDLNGYSAAAKQIDDGMKSAGHLFNAMDGMFKLQIKLAKEYEKYASTHEAKISKMTEYDPVKQVILDNLKIARCNAAHHRQIAEEISTKCSEPAKQWKELTWKKSFFGPSNAQKDQIKKFKDAQSPWEKLYKSNASHQQAYYKATQAEKTARQTHSNAALEQNDQKAAKLAQELEQKKNDCQAKEQQYKQSSAELEDEKNNYVQNMNNSFEAAMDFEKNRLVKTSELIVAFNEALSLEKNADTVFELKSKDKNAEPQRFNVIETLKKVRQSAESINIEENLNIYNNKMGPNNATNMEWPAFQPYDESKNGMANSKMVAEGNVASGQEGVYNQSAEYDSPQPQQSQSYDSEPESEPGPVQIADTSGEFTAMVKHPWAKQDDDELELVEGEVVYVLGEPDEEGWCRGRKDDGTEGLFPADYVDLGEAAA